LVFVLFHKVILDHKKYNMEQEKTDQVNSVNNLLYPVIKDFGGFG